MQQKLQPEQQEPALDSQHAKQIIEYLDKQCLINSKVGQLLFEQFLIYCLLTEKSLVKSRGLNQNQSSFSAYIGKYRIFKMNQIYNDVQPPTAVKLRKDGKKQAVVDDSFEPFLKCLQYLFDYYIIEFSSTLNQPLLDILPNKIYKNFCMHINVFSHFLQDFQSSRINKSNQQNNYAAIFRHIWKEMSGFYVDMHKGQDASQKPKPPPAKRDASKNDDDGGTAQQKASKKEKQNEAIQQQQEEQFERQKQLASFLVFSDFFEIMFRMALFTNQDENKSDILKFKEFLHMEVINNLKFQLRVKKGEEYTKPHKVRVSKALMKFHKVHSA